MTQLLNPCLIGWRSVIEAARQNQGNYNRYATAKRVVELSDSARLTERDMIELAIQIDIKVFPTDKILPNYLGESRQVITGLPKDWIPTLCESYYSLAYHNPCDPLEYIAIVPQAARGRLPHIIHHTSDGYVNPSWFNEIVPILEELSYDKRVKNKIGKIFKDQKLTLGQVNTISHYFKEDPILKILGVCTKCYEG